MPKALSEFPLVDGYEYGKLALRAKPEFSSAITEIIFAMSSIDRWRIDVICLAIGDDIHAAISLYEMIKTQKDRRRALLAVAKFGLTAEQLSVLEKIEERTTASSGDRNKFSHQIWAFSQNLPNALIVLPNGTRVDKVVKSPLGNLQLPSFSDRAEVYSLEELRGMADKAWECVDYYHKFCICIKSTEDQERLDEFGGKKELTEEETHYRDILEGVLADRSKIWDQLKLL